MNRTAVRARFDRSRRKGELIVGAAVGAGVTARGAIHAGADFLIALSAGRLRMMGAPSISSCFPIYEAGEFVEDFAVREFSTLKDTPILVGLSAMNPMTQSSDVLQRLVDLGFAGVVNWPTTCVLPTSYKDAMELAGHGFSAELDILRQAKDYGLFSCAFVDTPEQAALASASGVDMINFVFGWSKGGQLGHTKVQTASEACGLLKAAARAIQPSKDKTYFVTEGGPIIESSDLNDLFRFVTIDGYVGGSTFDRIAIEEGIKNSVVGFKDAHRKFRALTRQEDVRVAFGNKIGLIGGSEIIFDTVRTIHSFAEAGVSTLALCGEAGTEVEVVADNLTRQHSKAGDAVWIRCAEMTQEQLAQRLFGHKGRGVAGLLGSKTLSHLVLVGCDVLKPAMQNRLARALVQGTYRPIGGAKRQRAGMSIILVQESLTLLTDELRAALQGATVEIPPLRNRPQDVPDILDAMLKDVPRTRRPQFTPSGLHALRRHTWAANLWEVEAFATRLIQSAPDRALGEKDVRHILDAPNDNDAENLSDRMLILQTLSRNGFRKGQTAEQLGISRKTLYNRMQRYGIRS